MKGLILQNSPPNSAVTKMQHLSLISTQLLIFLRQNSNEESQQINWNRKREKSVLCLSASSSMTSTKLDGNIPIFPWRFPSHQPSSSYKFIMCKRFSPKTDKSVFSSEQTHTQKKPISYHSTCYHSIPQSALSVSISRNASNQLFDTLHEYKAYLNVYMQLIS